MSLFRKKAGFFALTAATAEAWILRPDIPPDCAKLSHLDRACCVLHHHGLRVVANYGSWAAIDATEAAVRGTLSGVAPKPDPSTNTIQQSGSPPMPTIPRTPREVGALAGRVADRLESGDRSFDLEVNVADLDAALVAARHQDGSTLVHGIAVVLLRARMESGKVDRSSDHARRRTDQLPPYDSAADVLALRTLAAELGGRS